jgi:hypothetical protein
LANKSFAAIFEVTFGNRVRNDHGNDVPNDY